MLDRYAVWNGSRGQREQALEFALAASPVKKWLDLSANSSTPLQSHHSAAHVQAWVVPGNLSPLASTNMLNLFWKKRSETVTVSASAPLAGRHGHVGGIESLVLDEVTYFFGFDFRSDLVLSPLIDNIDDAALFASQHMLQIDGAHDAAYWRELAELAVDGSALCESSEDRTFSSRIFASTLETLLHVHQTGSTVPAFSIEYHLLYLLGAAGGWAVDISEIESAIAIISGAEPLPEETCVANVAQHLRVLLRDLVSTAPGNWSVLFSALNS